MFDVTIRSYRPEDQTAVVELFSSGMLENAEGRSEFAKLMWRQYVANSVQSDLADIKGVYFATGGHFWVATVVDGCGKEAIVGMVALEAKTNNEAELRRMSVRTEYRRFGVGRKLIAHLEKWATQEGFKKLWLSTGGRMAHAHKFYSSVGFANCRTEAIAGVDVVFFEKSMAIHA